jgi:hypothetical protein
MNRLACWRWVLPFAQLCVVLICLEWIATQRLDSFQEIVKMPPRSASSGETASVGWTPRSCWGCRSTGPLPKLLFFGILGVFFWVGGELDRSMADDGRRRIPLFIVAGASCIGAVAYTPRGAIGAAILLAMVAFFSAAVGFGRRVASRFGAPARIPGAHRSRTAKPIRSVALLVTLIAVCIATECIAVWIVFRRSPQRAASYSATRCFALSFACLNGLASISESTSSHGTGRSAT